MKPSPRTAAVAAIAIASFLLAFANGSTGDYPHDAGPTIDALLRGDLHEAFASQPIMGVFSVLLRLPFAGFAKALGGGELAVYRLGCVPCLFALGLLGLMLAREMANQGVARPACAAAGALCLVNPLTWEALRLGHPEEMLGAALVAGAALATLRGNSLGAGIALGLALATKQWAAIAVLPVLAGATQQRLRLALVAGAVALSLTLPMAIGSVSGFAGATHQAAWSGKRVYPFNALWPVAPLEDRVISVAGDTKVVTVRTVPTSLAHLLHPLIVLLAIPFTAAWLLRRRRLEPEDLLVLLALLFLLRCLLDPVDNVYYHLPFAVFLIAWEGLGRRSFPLFAMLTSLGVWFAIRKATMIDELALRNAAYLAATLPFAIWLSVRLFAGARTSAAPARAPGARAAPRVAVAGR